MVQQTSVEWLQEQIFNSDWKNMNGEDKLKLFEQAKQMEKQQIVDAVNKFALSSDEVVRIILKKYNLLNTGERYYNETYGS